LKREVGGTGAGRALAETGVPGEAEYRNKGVTYCPHCDGPLFKGKKVAVIGGGNSGVEAAIDLAGIVEHVTLLEFDKQTARRRSAAAQAAQPAQRQRARERADHPDARRRQQGAGLLYTDRSSGESHQSSFPACSCRSACCRTPNG
jgi:alkyl hydroperoxide reductase subunit F